MRKQSSYKSPLKTFQSLQSFKLNPKQKAQLYPNAVNIPQFLVDNLKSQNRVIKEFTGQDAIVKAFYFNLMRLAFELPRRQANYSQVVQQILIGQHEFGNGGLQDKQFSDQQYRSFVRQFFGILSRQQVPNFQDTIECYPIVDEILTKMFRQLVPFTLKLKDSSDFDMSKRIFQYLCKKFKLTLQIMSGCFKLTESGVYVYVGSVNQVYLIFMDQLAIIKEATEGGNSDYLDRSNNSNIQMSESSCASKMLSQTEIPKKDDKQNQGKKVFTTVINVLDDNKSAANSRKLSSSIKGRHSLEQEFDKQFQMFQKGSDRVEEKDKFSIEEYYDVSTHNPRPQMVSTTSVNRPEKSTKFVLHSQTFPVKIQQPYSKLGSPFANQLQNISNKKVSQATLPVFATSKLTRFQQEIEIKNVRPSFSKVQAQSNQNKWKKYPTTPKVSDPGSKQNQSIANEKSPVGSEESEGQVKSPIKFYKKIPTQSISSKLSSQGANLQIFSNIKAYESNGFSSKNSKFQGTGSKGFGKAKQNRVEDKSYEKFTDSGLLQILDEEYRTRIKSIKQKYRQLRTKVQPAAI